MKVPDTEQDALPAAANDSWRTWLMTGVRRPPVGRRRIRGAHRGLKRMLAEGMRGSNDQPYTWKEFSDAMVRQSVGDAVRALPVADAQVLKLAYFGGLSNEEIARRLDLTVAAVERRLREALDHISEHVERGRSHGREGLAQWSSGCPIAGCPTCTTSCPRELLWPRPRSSRCRPPRGRTAQAVPAQPPRLRRRQVERSPPSCRRAGPRWGTPRRSRPESSWPPRRRPPRRRWRMPRLWWVRWPRCRPCRCRARFRPPSATCRRPSTP